MEISSTKLIEDLQARTQKHVVQAKELQQKSVEELNRRPAPDSWSVLECIEHLNLYGDFYLPALQKSIEANKYAPEPQFRSGLLGNYFANVMLPRKKLNKMKTFKDKNTLGMNLSKQTVSRFIEQQEKILLLLEKAKKINLNKSKTPVSISKWIKLKIGDTFRVVVYHNERHLAQAFRALNGKD